MTLVTGRVAVNAAPQPLTSNPLSPNAFIIKAPSSNTNPVFIGPSDVTTGDGHVLEPGDEFEYECGYRDLSQPNDLLPGEVYVVGTAPDVVTWLAFR